MDFDNPKVYGDTFISDGLVLQKVILYAPVPTSKMFDLKKRASNPQQLEHYVKKSSAGGSVVLWLQNLKNHCKQTNPKMWTVKYY